MTAAIPADTAKGFVPGRSQAVRFDVDELTMRCLDDGLRLTPGRRDWVRRVTAAFDALNDSAPLQRSADRDQAERQDRHVGERDWPIAAQAQAQGLTVGVDNTREFARVPGLRLEDWAQ